MQSRYERKHQRRKSKPKRLVKILGLLVLLLLFGGGAYAYSTYDAIKQTAGKMHVNIDTGSGNKTFSEGKPINLLLLGVDERPNDKGRSDAMIVATLNPKTNSLLMTSIPRDTRTVIAGRGTTSKINSAYAYGGTEMAMKTVENFMDIKIDDVIKVNMEGLVDLVNAVGGVTVHNDLSWIDEGYYKKGYHYRKGDIHLNGEQAIGYVRMRHKDPRGDFGRNQRQRQVIQAVVKKGASIRSVGNLKEILDAIGSNVKTSLTFDDMKDIAQNYRDCRQNIYSYEVHGVPQMIDGGSYVIVSDQEKAKVHNMIQDEQDGQLDMSKYKTEN
ncbi:LytR family transcriptional attenuator [Scopulibacillus darangshiensis]|uniref:LytR family transcriptional attenuator n=1 Tax=Scopulibacillus darangshiensis TaxID=442528 RepID=A0A4V2SN63_9BACL|nr:LCP family protein [Scopulibacillus darangshiensis]TCP30006.1 LytR family transcriptional attenuator [Scopulibacillus darangshiensis]